MGKKNTVICRKYNFIHKNSKESSGHVFSTMAEYKIKISELVMFPYNINYNFKKYLKNEHNIKLIT